MKLVDFFSFNSEKRKFLLKFYFSGVIWTFCVIHLDRWANELILSKQIHSIVIELRVEFNVS